MGRVAVVYLARVPQGIQTFRPFAQSYREYSAGHPHDLVLLGKGMTKAGERVATTALFENIPHQVIEIPDDGYDIHAYLKVAELLDHDYICFFNTYSELRSPSWLKKLYDQISQADVGLVGTTASYESLYSSVRFISKAIWLSAVKVCRFDPILASQFRPILDEHAPQWMVANRSLYRRLRRAASDLIKRRTGIEADEGFEFHWDALTRDGAPLAPFRDVPPFPNPHIRSNGFMISRKLLLSFGYEVGSTKEACARFESGPDGLSRRVREEGLKHILVGADGVGYDTLDWPKSRTFRLGEQENLMVHDNQSRSFAAFEPLHRELHVRMTWGDYLEPAKPKFRSLGVEFPQSACITNDNFVRRDVKSKLADIFVSVVIPTHNRLSLVKQAIETIRRQAHQDWEAVVFDNASEEPVSNHVASLRDRRIRCERSADFLPVTDSWNRAIDLARGDYVIVIGDDDGLTPDFFSRVAALVHSFGRPDVIYSAIYQFFHPGVAPWQPAGYVADLRNGFFFVNRTTPFMLDLQSARKAVAGSLNIERNFTFNMQAFVFSKEFLAKIRHEGKIFHSPFPDYYLANVAMGLAERIVVEPTPLAIAGVSTASFGFTLFNNLEQRGAELLKFDLASDPAFENLNDVLLPGPAYDTNYIVTMEHVARRLNKEAPQRPNLQRYREMQIFKFVTAQPHRFRWVKALGGAALWSKLTPRERIWATVVSYLHKERQRSGSWQQTRFEKIRKRLDHTSFSPLSTLKNVGDFVTTTQLFDALEKSEL